MFQFPGFASAPYEFRCGYPPYDGWVSPFGNPRIKACLSAPRGLSQTTTSFIAFYRLGIHRMHLFTWPYNLKHTLRPDPLLDHFVIFFVWSVTYISTRLPSLKICLVLNQIIQPLSTVIVSQSKNFSWVSSLVFHWLKRATNTACCFPFDTNNIKTIWVK